MKLPLQQFWLLLWCWTCTIPIRQTSALTKLSTVTIRHWFERFRAHLPEEAHILERIVQLDEAYFKRMTLMMGKQTGTRKLAYAICSGDPQRQHVAAFLFQKVKPDSALWTDGAAIIAGLINGGRSDIRAIFIANSSLRIPRRSKECSGITAPLFGVCTITIGR